MVFDRDLPDDEVILVVDSTDVLLMPCGRNLRQEFAKFNADIVVSSYPFQVPDRHKQFMFPPSVEYDKGTAFPSDTARKHFQGQR